MKLHRIAAVILRHTCEARHNLNRIAEMVYWPVQNIVVWGFFTIYLARDNHLRPGAVSFLLGAAILCSMRSILYSPSRSFRKCLSLPVPAGSW